jgi:hypothetical protein
MMNLTENNKFKNDKKLNKLCLLSLFVYFLFCSILHDPKVLVDDSPNKPLFRELLLNATSVSINSINLGSSQKRRSSHGSINIFNSSTPTFQLRPILLYCVIMAVFLLKILDLKFFTSSMPARAPSSISIS